MLLKFRGPGRSGLLSMPFWVKLSWPAQKLIVSSWRLGMSWLAGRDEWRNEAQLSCFCGNPVSYYFYTVFRMENWLSWSICETSYKIEFERAAMQLFCQMMKKTGEVGYMGADMQNSTTCRKMPAVKWLWMIGGCGQRCWSEHFDSVGFPRIEYPLRRSTSGSYPANLS